MSRKIAYREACARADERRAVMMSSLNDAKARIAPARLKEDVKAKIASASKNGLASAIAKVEERPVATSAAAGAFALYLFRRPLTALFGRLYVRFKDRNPEHSETDDG